MAKPVGKVIVSEGDVSVTGSNGETRVLQVNSPIFEGDEIITGVDSRTLIQISNGPELVVGQESNVLVDADVINSGVSEEALQDQAAEVEAIQAALEAGEELNLDQLAATAAGPGGPTSAGGGRQIVEFTKDLNEQDPQGVAPTVPPDRDFRDPETFQDDERLVQAAPPPPEETPPPEVDEPSFDEPLPPPPPPPPPPTPPDDEPIIIGGSGVLDETFLSPEGDDDTEENTDPPSELPSNLPIEIDVDFGIDEPGSVYGNGEFTAAPDSTVPESWSLTSQGREVTVTLDGDGNYIGTVPDGPDDGEDPDVVFTLIYNSDTETYTYRQLEPLDHPDTTTPDDSIFLTFGVTAEDDDGDTASGTVTVEVKDDGPTIDYVSDAFIANESGPVLTGILDVLDGADFGTTGSLLANVDPNADGWNEAVGQHTLWATADESADQSFKYVETTLTSIELDDNEEPLTVYYVVYTANPEILVATTDLINPGDEKSWIFTVTASPSSDEYEIKMYGELFSIKSVDFDEFDGKGGSGPDGYVYLNDDGEVNPVATGPTVATFTAVGGQIQTSNAGSSLHIGVGSDSSSANNWVNAETDEVIVIDFGLPGDNEDDPYNSALLYSDGNPATDDAEINVGLDIKTSSSVWVDYNLYTYDDKGDDIPLNDEYVLVGSGSEEIPNATGEITFSTDDLSEITYTNGDEINISKIELTVSDANETDGNAGFRVGGLAYGTETSGEDITETFAVDVYDSDGDVDSATFDVEFDVDNEMTGTDADEVFAGGDDNETISGGGGDDIIDGGGGDDVLDGGDGADEISGGEGADTLVAGSDTDVDTLDGGDGSDTGYYDEFDETNAGAAEDTATNIENLTDSGDTDPVI